MKLIVTRPQPQAAQWVEALRARGVDAHALPLIDIEPANEAGVAQAWHTLATIDLVVFVSPNAVAQFFAQRPHRAAWPASLAAATPGPGSAAALRACGVASVIAPEADAAQFDSEALWPQLAGRPWAGRRVLVVRGDGGREWLADQLRAAGAEVSPVQAYRRVVPVLDAQQRALLDAARAEPAQHAWHFSSSQAIDHLERLVSHKWSGAHALASHPRIADRARAAGFGDVHTVPPALDAVAAFVQKPHLQSPAP